MYSVNGVALDNPSMRWSIQAESKPLGDFSKELSDVSAPGRDGVAAERYRLYRATGGAGMAEARLLPHR